MRIPSHVFYYSLCAIYVCLSLQRYRAWAGETGRITGFRSTKVIAANRIRRIIFILEPPLTVQLKSVYNIEKLRSSGFVVDIWNLTGYLHPEFAHEIDREEALDARECEQFARKEEILQAFSGITLDTMVNCFVPLQPKTFFIFRQLSVQMLRYCVFQFISFPSPGCEENGPWARLSHVAAKVNLLGHRKGLTTLRNSLLTRLYYLPRIRPANLALLSGVRSLELRNPLVAEGRTHLLWVHAYDYDTYLSLRGSLKPPDPLTGVFLDEYLPLHTDYQYLGCDAPMEAREYYANLRAFFDFLEKTYHVRIIIAAHPRSQYNESRKDFGDRPVIRGRTAELVRDSGFVLAHMSTSINLAVLFRRPILFMTMDALQRRIPGRHFVGDHIDVIAHALHREPIKIDRVTRFDWEHAMRVDEEAYAAYQNDYIKKDGTPEIPFWDIYAHYLRNPPEG